MLENIFLPIVGRLLLKFSDVQRQQSVYQKITKRSLNVIYKKFVWIKKIKKKRNQFLARMIYVFNRGIDFFRKCSYEIIFQFNKRCN